MVKRLSEMPEVEANHLRRIECPTYDDTPALAGKPLAGRRVELKENHTVAGNPIRFTRGPLEIRADAEWQALMPARQRAVVTGLTWPLLWRYGFLGERRGRTRLPSPSP